MQARLCLGGRGDAPEWQTNQVSVNRPLNIPRKRTLQNRMYRPVSCVYAALRSSFALPKKTLGKRLMALTVPDAKRPSIFVHFSIGLLGMHSVA
jgi:hypothetical protein